MDTTPCERHEDVYLSYLLRLWREDDRSNPWRASLESVDTGRRNGFANLESLFEYLRLQTAEPDLSQKGS